MEKQIRKKRGPLLHPPNELWSGPGNGKKEGHRLIVLSDTYVCRLKEKQVEKINERRKHVFTDKSINRMRNLEHIKRHRLIVLLNACVRRQRTHR